MLHSKKGCSAFDDGGRIINSSGCCTERINVPQERILITNIKILRESWLKDEKDSCALLSPGFKYYK